MSPAEMAGRGVDAARRTAWSRRQVLPGAAVVLPCGLREDRLFPTPLPAGTREQVTAQARAALVAAADRLLDGEWSLLGAPRPDVRQPDWFLDPVTGRRAPQDTLAFRVDHRDERVTGNVKAVWELSRHHHLTVLASAWWLTGENVYAEVVAEQLRSWWSANPFLSGVHWTSGIELGVRVISWAWVRRLMHEWPKIEELFDTNEEALCQIWGHQKYLAAFPSRGSSANNHVVAEACGLLVGACAFPWYTESEAWREAGARLLERELGANTFDSGVNRELASDYHRFVTELGLVAAAEAGACGHPLRDATWALLSSSLDAAAAMVDASGRPPRQGDGDEGRALILDDPAANPWGLLLDLGDALVGDRPWWPDRPKSVVATAMGGLVPSPPRSDRRPDRRPQVFPDAGMCFLRTPPEDGPEIWCRCDGGPHGFLSIAAHAHADALAIEVRYGGVEVLVDPGTYCYHGEPEWRSYFRSTLAHNTIEIDGASQSVEGGPFLWSTHTDGYVNRADVDGTVQMWSAHHNGYGRLDPALRHQRIVTLDRASRTLCIADRLVGRAAHTLRLPFHLGPDIEMNLCGTVAELTWPGDTGAVEARLHLPEKLRWSAHRGETEPVLGWYSPVFGRRLATTSLVGEGGLDHALELRTHLVFPESGHSSPQPAGLAEACGPAPGEAPVEARSRVGEHA